MTIGLAIAAIAIVYFMIVSPGFRKTVGVIVVIAAALIGWLINNSNEEARRYEAGRAATERFAATAIRTDDLFLMDVSLRKPSYAAVANWDEWIIEGTVTNNSRYSLGSLAFEVIVTDCPASGKSATSDASRNDCRTVGQQRQSASVQVPPGQTRAFSSYAIKFPGMPRPYLRFLRTFSWTVT